MASTIKIKAFGQLAELLGSSVLEITSLQTSNELKHYLNSNFPAFKNIHYSIAINQHIVVDDISINHDSEIALLPPFSGG